MQWQNNRQVGYRHLYRLCWVFFPLFQSVEKAVLHYFVASVCTAILLAVYLMKVIDVLQVKQKYYGLANELQSNFTFSLAQFVHYSHEQLDLIVVSITTQL